MRLPLLYLTIPRKKSSIFSGRKTSLFFEPQLLFNYFEVYDDDKSNDFGLAFSCMRVWASFACNNPNLKFSVTEFSLSVQQVLEDLPWALKG
jgi:hypothetical protein